MNGPLAILPEQTHALVVGIEAYPRRHSLDLIGPAADALNFARWLRRRGVPAANLKILVSTRSEERLGAGLEGVDLFNGLVNLAVVENALESCRRTRSRLLLLFWTGHGIMTADQVRRPLLANYSDTDPHNLNVESLQEHLRSSTFFYPAYQVILFDMCATLFDERLRRESLIDHKFQSGPARLDCQQFLLYAAADRQAAENLLSERTGLYFKELMPILDQEPGWPPEMKRVIGKLEDRFEELRTKGLTAQQPIYQYWRAPSGQGETKYLGPRSGNLELGLRPIEGLPLERPESQSRSLLWKQALTWIIIVLPSLLFSEFGLGLAPPWPNRWVVTPLTIPLTFLVYHGVWHWGAAKPRPWLGRFLRWNLAACIAILLFYLFLFVHFTYPLPDHWHRDIGGFTYTEKASMFRQLPGNLGISDQDLVRESESDVAKVFGNTSLGMMRLTFLVSWLTLFASGSSLAAGFLLWKRPLPG